MAGSKCRSERQMVGGGVKSAQPWLPHQGLEEEAAMGTKDSADFIRRSGWYKRGHSGNIKPQTRLSTAQES